MRNIPATPTYPPGPRFSQQSPRYPSPRQQGVFPTAMTRGSTGKQTRPRHQPYQRPGKSPSNFDQQSPNTPSAKLPSDQVIKIEGDSTSTSNNEQAHTPSTPTHVKSEASDRDDDDDNDGDNDDDDAVSHSSASTIPNETADMKLGDKLFL